MKQSKNLGRRPNLLAFCKRQDQKLLLKPPIYAVSDGSRVQWRRSAICPKDSFAQQSADLKSLWVFEGKALKVLTLSTQKNDVEKPWAPPKPACFL